MCEDSIFINENMIEFSNKHGDFQARTKSTFSTFVL